MASEFLSKYKCSAYTLLILDTKYTEQWNLTMENKSNEISRDLGFNFRCFNTHVLNIYIYIHMYVYMKAFKNFFSCVCLLIFHVHSHYLG